MTGGRQGVLAKLRGWIGGVLLVAGIGLLALTGALYVSAETERAGVEAEQLERESKAAATATARALVEATELVRADPPTPTEPSRLQVAAGDESAIASSPTTEPQARAQPSATLTSAAATVTPTVAPVTPTPRPPPEILRILAATIDLDAPVILSRLENGEWEVPKFVAGHLEGTAWPGRGGNVVLSGHVESLVAGNVFARLEELQPGDEVTLRTDQGEFVYRTVARRVVANDDLSVVQNGADEALTLITCTGTFNPLTRDYSHRLIVVAERASA